MSACTASAEKDESTHTELNSTRGLQSEVLRIYLVVQQTFVMQFSQVSRELDIESASGGREGFYPER